jgi:hypothetical protein
LSAVDESKKNFFLGVGFDVNYYDAEVPSSLLQSEQEKKNKKEFMHVKRNSERM